MLGAGVVEVDLFALEITGGAVGPGHVDLGRAERHVAHRVGAARHEGAAIEATRAPVERGDRGRDAPRAEAEREGRDRALGEIGEVGAGHLAAVGDAPGVEHVGVVDGRERAPAPPLDGRRHRARLAPWEEQEVDRAGPGDARNAKETATLPGLGHVGDEGADVRAEARQDAPGVPQVEALDVGGLGLEVAVGVEERVGLVGRNRARAEGVEADGPIDDDGLALAGREGHENAGPGEGERTSGDGEPRRHRG